jgi:hypothetical protein
MPKHLVPLYAIRVEFVKPHRKKPPAFEMTYLSKRWRLGWHGDSITAAPWLCVAVFLTVI